MDVLAYLDKAVATYDGDPPANDYQRGHLDALKVTRAEMASALADEAERESFVAGPSTPTGAGG
jgi:hypothetical protein